MGQILVLNCGEEYPPLLEHDAGERKLKDIGNTSDRKMGGFQRGGTPWGGLGLIGGGDRRPMLVSPI